MKIIEQLKDDGWKESSVDPMADIDEFKPTLLYKTFETPTRCSCNDHIEGIQVCVSISERLEYLHFEVRVDGESEDGSWIFVRRTDRLKDVEDILSTIPKILKAWEDGNNE